MCNMICAQDFVVFVNSKAYFELSKQYSIKNLVEEDNNNITLIDNETKTEYNLFVETVGEITSVILDNEVILRIHNLKVDCFNKYLIACVGLLKRKK